MDRFRGGREVVVSGMARAAAPRRGFGNRLQITLFVLLTLALTGASIWAGRKWYNKLNTLTFVVEDAASPSGRFATKLAGLVADGSNTLRIKIVTVPDPGGALARLDRAQGDLAIARTDSPLPRHGRALAVLDRQILLLLTPKASKIKDFADLKGGRIAVLDDGPGNAAFVRKAFSAAEVPTAGLVLDAVPAAGLTEKLLPAGNYAALAMVEMQSKIAADPRFAELAKRPGGMAMVPMAAASAAEKRSPGLYSLSIDAGLLVAVPQIPGEDSDTLSAQWLLLARDKVAEAAATELTRLIVENRQELGLEGEFATRIEQADTDKDALVQAHPGAQQYLDNETKSFLDRYSDMIYLGMAAASVIGSILATIYTLFTRIAPTRASELSVHVLELDDRIDAAATLAELDAVEDELEAIVRSMIIGLRDRTVDDQGIGGFRIGYELVRDSLAMRRVQIGRGGASPAEGVQVPV